MPRAQLTLSTGLLVSVDKLATPAQSQGAVETLAVSCVHGPISQAFGLTEADWRTIAATFVDRAVSLGCSVIATSPTGTVLGALLGVDASEPLVVPHLSPNGQKYIEFLSKLATEAFPKFPKSFSGRGSAFRLIAVGVIPEARREAVFVQMHQVNRELLQATGFKYWTSEMGSSYQKTMLSKVPNCQVLVVEPVPNCADSASVVVVPI